MKLRLPAALLLLFVLSLPAAIPSQAALEDLGPLPVGYRDISFVDANFGRGNITGRIYYPAAANGRDTPANPAAGPFPLVAFQHGYLGQPADYDLLCTQMASYGFVIASIGTETSLLGSMQPEALDTRSLLHWVDDQAAENQSFLFNLVDDGTWSAVGHSMGGGALNYLIADEPRVRLFIALQPYSGPLLGGSGQGSKNLQAFTGRSYFLAGSIDQVVPADGVRQYFDDADEADRRIYYYGLGLGHLGPTDTGAFGEPLSAGEQLDLHKRIVTGTLRAELNDTENIYYDLVGGGSKSQPLQIQTGCGRTPILWLAAGETAGAKLIAGLAGDAGVSAVLADSKTSARITTPRGELQLKPGTQKLLFRGLLPGTGITEVALPPSAASGRYFQGVSLGAEGGLSRTEKVEF